MQITGQAVVRTCAICDRSLLQGERAVRYAPDGGEFVDVCPLCQEIAAEYGWVKEGSPTTPTVPAQRRRRRGGLLASIFAPLQSSPEPTVASEPILRRLTDPELAIVEAADEFNASPYRRTVGGIAKSLGPPRVSVVPLSGVNTEVVITIAWEISWYQYRIIRDSAQPVRLAERGHELGELDDRFKHWNARLDRSGRIAPNIPRL